MSRTHISINLGPPFLVVFLTFMILKLCKVISWSWLWVTAPLWMPLGVGLACFIGFLLFIGFVFVLAALFH